MSNSNFRKALAEQIVSCIQNFQERLAEKDKIIETLIEDIDEIRTEREIDGIDLCKNCYCLVYFSGGYYECSGCGEHPLCFGCKHTMSEESKMTISHSSWTEMYEYICDDCINDDSSE